MALRHYAAGISGWGRLQPDRGYDFCGLALDEGEDVLLVDPVAPQPDEFAGLQALGSKFTIVLLNADHERASATLARTLGATVWAPRADLALLAQPGAQPFEDGHVFVGGWTAHTVAHLKTPGETVLHHAESGTLVVGDALIADPLTGLRLPPPGKVPDRDAAWRSLRALCDRLEFDAVYFGDGFSLPQGGKAAMLRLLEREQRAL